MISQDSSYICKDPVSEQGHPHSCGVRPRRQVVGARVGCGMCGVQSELVKRPRGPGDPQLKCPSSCSDTVASGHSPHIGPLDPAQDRHPRQHEERDTARLSGRDSQPLAPPQPHLMGKTLQQGSVCLLPLPSQLCWLPSPRLPSSQLAMPPEAPMLTCPDQTPPPPSPQILISAVFSEQPSPLLLKVSIFLSIKAKHFHY